MKELVIALMVWASAHTGLPVPEVEVPVVFRERCELAAMAQVPCTEEGVEALQTSGTIFLPDDWTARRPYHVAMLLHELVHVMQHHAGVPKEPCEAETWERPAYAAHFAYLESMGLDPLESSKMNSLMHILVTTCLGNR